MNAISVRIPKNDYYTTYAEGVFLSMDTESEDGVIINLDADYTFFLYYTFKFHRRLYICSTKIPGNDHKFENVNEPVKILCQLRGRAFDEFKRSVNYLNKSTKGSFYHLPPMYFWQLAALCRARKNSRINLELLTKRYNPGIIFEEIQWRKLK